MPDAAQALIDQPAALLPHIKITELLMEVDEWTGFTRHFTHLKSGDTAQDKTLLLTTILDDGINLGLSKMAESCPGTTYARLSWLQAWRIRDETYSSALGELVIVDQDHRAVKRVTRPMLNSKSFRAAKCVLASIELMHMIRKGQLMMEGCNARSFANQFYALAGKIRPV